MKLMTNDNPDQRINQKMFQAQVQHNFKELKKEEMAYGSLLKEEVDEKAIREVFLRIKIEAKAIIEDRVLK